MQFRPDVEGLRAVAILLVVAAHARVPGLEGGFVGVDVFFVLSGFLITGLLVSELKTTGRVDLAAFYARRFRRLLPALIIMLAVTAVLASMLLSPLEQQSQVATFTAAALWLSNFHFALSDLDYFGAVAETNLALHTWSLGVEEQFYLLWPAWLLFLAGAYAWQGGKLAISRLKGGLLATVFVSLALSVFWTYTSPRLAFYIMPARTWQFAAGALVYLWTAEGLPGGRQIGAPWVMKTMGWCGLAFVVIAAFGIDRQTPYPGMWGVIPTLGTTLVLAAWPSPVPDGVSRLLSWSPLQSIGRVSYAWYLWHWPVLILGATLVPDDTLAARIALVAVALGIALVSYKAVETPFRRSPWWSKRTGPSLAAGVAVMIAACVGVFAWASRLPAWGQSAGQQPFIAIRSNLPAIYAYGCDDWYHGANVKQCVVGPADARKTAVVMGDSVALQWFPALAQAFSKPDWRLVVVTKSACPMVDHPVFYARIGRRYTECEAWRAEAIRTVASMKPDIVILGSSNGYPFDEGQWREGTQRILVPLAAHARHVFVIRGTPTLPFDGPACLSREQWRAQFFSASNRCHAERRDEPRVFSQLQRAAAGYDNVRVLDFNALICPSGICRAAQGDAIVFRDTQHVTASFIGGLAGSVEAAIAPALKRSTELAEEG